jgi:hypothetical protein
MTDRWMTRVVLFAAGVVPFALAGGLHGGATIWPWAAGFLCQATFTWSCCHSLKKRGKVFIF